MIASTPRYSVNNVMNGCVELCVYFDYKPAEVRQTSGLRYASPSNKKNFSARMGEKQTFWDRRRTAS